MVSDKQWELYDSNVKFCKAVQAQRCVYDREHPYYLKKEANDAAWEAIAAQCGDAVESCRTRWAKIRSAFVRSLHGNMNRTRSSNRTREYYLYDAVEFYLPYIVRADRALDSDNESDSSPAKGSSTDVADETAELSEQHFSAEGVAELNASGEEKADSKPGKQTSQLKSKVRTFYIKQKPTNVGTFIIKKQDEESESVTGSAKASDGEDLHEQETAADAANSEEEDDERRFRFRRACKRSLDKTMVRELRVRKREVEAKRPRRSHERVRAAARAETPKQKSPTKANLPQELQRLQNKQQNRAQQQQQQSEQKPELPLPKAVLEDLQLGNAPPPHSVPQLDWMQELLAVASNKQSSAPKLPQNKQVFSSPRVDQAVQCNLATTSGANSDQDFLNLLKPQMAEMNARQKLHFKKKIFESLMEVFDDAAGSVGNAASPAVKPQPVALAESVSGDELRLMRELVALVQAAKQTPQLLQEERELLVAAAAAEDGNASSTVAAAPNAQNMPNDTAAPAAAASRQPTVYRLSSNSTEAQSLNNMMRKVVRLNASGGGNGSGRDSEKRRIYRIYPRGSMTTTGPNGVGTFIIPRTSNSPAGAGGAMLPPVSAVASCNAKRHCGNTVVPASASMSAAGGTPAAVAVSTTSANAAQPPANSADTTVGGVARTLLRRYSVCGAGTVSSMPRRYPSNKSPTSSASVLPTPLTTFTTFGPNGTPRRVMRISSTRFAEDHGSSHFQEAGTFKVPRAVAANTHTTSATGTSPTATLSSAMPAATLPISGFSQYMQGKVAPKNPPMPVPPTSIKPTKRATASSSSQARNEASPTFARPEPISVQHLNKSKSRNSESTEKLKKFLETDEASLSTAGIIGSDNFAGLQIKTEPLDDDYP